VIFKTSSVNYIKYGEVYNELGPLKNERATRKRTLHIQSDAFAYYYKADCDVYVWQKKGLAALVISADSEEKPEEFVLHKVVKINKGMYFNFIRLMDDASVELEYDYHARISLEFVDGGYAYQPMVATLQIRALLAYFYNVQSAHGVSASETLPYWQIIYVEKGTLVTEWNHQSFIVKSNELFVQPPGGVYKQFTRNEPCSYLTILFDMKCVNEKDYSRLAHRVYKADQEIRNALDAFVEADNKSYSNDMLLNLVHRILLKLVHTEHHPSLNCDGSALDARFENELLNEILLYINEHLYHSFNVEQLCDHFGMSRSSLQTLFNANLGIAPKQFITEAKLSKSKDLIATKNHSVSEISKMLGYSSIHYFSKVFKSEYGQTPAEYARSLSD
jgi:AraC-like DNA-binding protein